MHIFPALLSQDINELQTQIKLLATHCEGFHIDIMDGIFVRQKMGSIELTNQIAKISGKQLWIHLMVQNPLEYIEKLKIHAGDVVTFHYMENSNQELIIDALERKNLRPSLGINPKTQISTLKNALYAVDHVTVMSVEPGKAGQKFIPSTLKKLELLNAFKDTHERDLTIAVDGGVNAINITKLAALGVGQVAATTALFGTQDPVEALKELSKNSSRE